VLKWRADAAWSGPEKIDVIRWRPSQELVVLVCYTVALLSGRIAARIYPHIGPRRLAAGGLCGIVVVWSLIGLTSSGGDLRNVGMASSSAWPRAVLR
jgi:hypothetical protein